MIYNKVNMLRKIILIILVSFLFLLLVRPGFCATQAIQYLCELGISFYQMGRYEDALQEFKKVLALDPNNSTGKNYVNIIFAQEIGNPTQKKASEKSTSQEVVPKTERGAWTVPQGRLWCELYNKYYWHKSQFNDKGKKVEWSYNGNYDEIRTELKLEYGLTDDLTLLLYLPYKEAHWRDDNGKKTSRALVDIWTGAKYRLFSQPLVTSLQARVKIPTNYNENDTPSLGRRQIDGEVKLLLGKSLWPIIKGYTKIELGFRARAQEPTNEIPYFYELGYSLTDYLILKATVDGIEGLSGTGKVDEDYTKWNFSTIFKIKFDLSLELGYGQTFAGKNSSAAEEIILSLAALF